MGRSKLNTLLCLALTGACAHQAYAANPNDFAVFNYDMWNDGTADLPGRLYIPSNYDSSKSYPLVIFFHGSGESGNNNTSQVNGNIDNLLAAAKRRQFFLYAPQCGGWWGGTQFELALDMVAKATRTYSIDTSKLYTTGLSLGGGATWDINQAYSGNFAAAVPLSGTGPGDTNAARYGAALANLPLWVYHARDDANGATNVAVSRNVINNIRAAKGLSQVTFPLNGSPSNPFYNTGSPYYSDGSTFFNNDTIRYSEYATGGHSNATWGRAYNEQPMYDWLLSQSRPQPKPAVGQKLLFGVGIVSHGRGVADSQGRQWNTTMQAQGLTVGPAMAFAATTTGARTGVFIDVTSAFSDAGGGATSGALYDSDFTTNGWQVGDWSHAGALTKTGKLSVRGLTPGAAYQIALFASQTADDAGYGKVTRYTIGGIWRDLNVVGNLTNQAVFPSVLADPSGSIDLSVAVSPDSNSRWAYLSTIEVTAVPEPASLVGLLLPAGILLKRRARQN
jgi:hypothetical protein